MPNHKIRPRHRLVRDQASALANAINDEITHRETSAYALAKAAGVDPSIVQRFMSGERNDLRLSTASLLCAALGLRLVPTARRPSVRGRANPANNPLKTVAPPRNTPEPEPEPGPTP